MDRNKESVKTYNKAAKNYQEKVMKMDLYDDTYDKFCWLIDKKNPEILEIACGPGNVTKYLNSKRPDFMILGIDLAPSMIELAKISNPRADFMIMDCRHISRLNKKFDAIVCGFCMPYLSKQECSKMIGDFSKLLKPGGLLYFSTMEGNYDKSGFETTSFSGGDKVFIYYHQEVFLAACLIANGFDLQKKQCLEPNGTFFTDMVFIAEKNKELRR